MLGKCALVDCRWYNPVDKIRCNWHQQFNIDENADINSVFETVFKDIYITRLLVCKYMLFKYIEKNVKSCIRSSSCKLNKSST